MKNLFQPQYLLIIFIVLIVILKACSGVVTRKTPITDPSLPQMLQKVHSPLYGNFPLLKWNTYKKFYERSQFYMKRQHLKGPQPVAIMMHGCAGLGTFYEDKPFYVDPDSNGDYIFDGGVSTYQNTYANFFANMGIIPYVVDSNGPRVGELYREGDLVISCYDTLQERHATYIPTRLEDVRRAIVYLAYRAKLAKENPESDEIYPDLHHLYIIGWSQGAETILRFTMDIDYKDGEDVLSTMESPFARLEQVQRNVPNYQINLIGVYPAAGHLLSKSKYLERERRINTAIFTGSADEFYSDVHDFQIKLQAIPGLHLYREFEDIPHSFDKDRNDLDMEAATNSTRRAIESFIQLTSEEVTENQTSSKE